MSKVTATYANNLEPEFLLSTFLILMSVISTYKPPAKSTYLKSKIFSIFCKHIFMIFLVFLIKQ
ncbi:putative membrane protein [Borreliella afzelii PKo]|uniref:Membrane protein n=1 Tax=Borreliella afzelii (strain PKo) TaxID=390236 RepID=G0IRW6_BORAP|nr:putative membrane protein [Borreliella afzelii PKo]